MSSSSSVQMNRAKELAQKQNQVELRNINNAHNETYTETVRKNEDTIKKTQEDYEIKLLNLRNDLEYKLAEIRNKHSERVKMENDRLDAELKDLKKAHEDQKNELILSQESEVKSIQESHNNFINNSRKNFEKEKIKYQK